MGKSGNCQVLYLITNFFAVIILKGTQVSKHQIYTSYI